MNSELLVAILLQVFEHRLRFFRAQTVGRSCKDDLFARGLRPALSTDSRYVPPFVAPLDAAGEDVQLMSSNRILESSF